MENPRVVVHESGRRWIDHVRARMRALPVQVRHSTSTLDCLELVRGRRRTLLLLEFGAQPLTGLELLDQVRSLDPEGTVLVVGRPVAAPVELLTRELGAVAFIREPVAPTEVADLVEHVLRTTSRAACVQLQ